MAQGRDVQSTQGRKFSPTRVGTISQHAHGRIESRVPQALPKQHRRCSAGRKAEVNGVKSTLEHNHRHEDEVRSGVTGAESGLFNKG